MCPRCETGMYGVRNKGFYFLENKFYYSKKCFKELNENIENIEKYFYKKESDGDSFKTILKKK